MAQTPEELKLEKTFRKIEEESERRAREEAELEEVAAVVAGASGSNTFPADSSVPQPLPGNQLDGNVSSTTLPPLASTSIEAKKRHRGSISISRIGQDSIRHSDYRGRSCPTTPTQSYSSVYPSGSAQGSSSSLSTNGFPDESHQEETHTTEKETIIRRRNTLTQAVGEVFARRITTGRSKHDVRVHAPDNLDPMIIGVSVEEQRVEHERDTSGDSDDASVPHSQITVVSVLRKSPSAGGELGGRKRSSSLVDMAKTLAKKIRRKSGQFAE